MTRECFGHSNLIKEMIDVRTRRTFRRLLPYLTTRTLLLLSVTGAPTTSQIFWFDALIFDTVRLETWLNSVQSLDCMIESLHWKTRSGLRDTQPICLVPRTVRVSPVERKVSKRCGHCEEVKVGSNWKCVFYSTGWGAI